MGYIPGTQLYEVLNVLDSDANFAAYLPTTKQLKSTISFRATRWHGRYIELAGALLFMQRNQA